MPAVCSARCPASTRTRLIIVGGASLLCVNACRTRNEERAEPGPLLGVASASELPKPAPVQKAAEVLDAGSSVPARPAVYAKSRYVWIREQPDGDTQWIGYLWIGGQAALKSSEPRSSPACKSWYAVEPRGWVCVNGENATLDPNDPTYLALKKHAPDVSSPWPHRYAESRGAERYRGIPTREQQREREWDVETHLARLAAARAG
ncbi:MAG TPA: L,D-transpeptidase, partial [Polyangiaceae bacterium]|nr:L,D-transpeptidase [Polyangiaceae bacterium]